MAATLRDKPANKYHTQEFTPPELMQELRGAGCSVTARNVFGQRRRICFPSQGLNHFCEWLLGDPSNRASPQVRKLRGMTPRYFILLASK